MKRPRSLAPFAPLVLFAAAALAAASSVPGCYGATEIAVAVTTTVKCGTGGVGMTTQLFTAAIGTRDFGTAPAAETTACGDAEPRVGTLSIVPTGARDDQFDLEVVGAVGVPTSDCRAASLGGDSGAAGAITPAGSTGCVVARRRVSFRPHKSLGFTVRLDAQCIGVPCGVDETCDLGICTATSLCDEMGCPRERASAGSPDLDASADAGDASDASPDALPMIDASAPRCGAKPTVVVANQAIVGQLALQGSDFVYVNAPGGSSASEIRRVPRDGSAAPTTLRSPAMLAVGTTIGAVAANATDLAWTEQGTNTSVFVMTGGAAEKGNPISGGDHDHTTIAFGKSVVVGFSALTFGGGGPQSAFTYDPVSGMFRAAANVLSSSPAEILADDEGHFYAVATDTVVHYTVDAMNGPSEAGRINVISGAVPDFALAGHTVYVAGVRTMTQGIFRIDRAMIGASFNDQAWFPMAPAELPRSMTTDGVSLYYATAIKIVRLGLMAMPPKAIPVASVTAGSTADRLQVDDQCVYWVEDGTRIMKQKK